MQTADLNSPVIPQRLLPQHQQCSPVIDQLIQKAGRSFCWKFSLPNLKWRPKTYSERWKLNSVILYFDYHIFTTTFSFHVFQSKLSFKYLKHSQKENCVFRELKIIWDNLMPVDNPHFSRPNFLGYSFRGLQWSLTDITMIQGKLNYKTLWNGTKILKV